MYNAVIDEFLTERAMQTDVASRYDNLAVSIVERHSIFIKNGFTYTNILYSLRGVFSLFILVKLPTPPLRRLGLQLEQQPAHIMLWLDAWFVYPLEMLQIRICRRYVSSYRCWFESTIYTYGWWISPSNRMSKTRQTVTFLPMTDSYSYRLAGSRPRKTNWFRTIILSTAGWPYATLFRGYSQIQNDRAQRCWIEDKYESDYNISINIRCGTDDGGW